MTCAKKIRFLDVALKGGETLKFYIFKLCITRWSSRLESVILICYNFVAILKVLSNILFISTKLEEKQKALDLENDKKMLNSSLTSVTNLRNNFTNIKETASALARKRNITPELEKKRQRKVKKIFEELGRNERPQNMERLFEMEVYKASIDIITTQLKNRFESMSSTYEKFNFRSSKNIASITNDELYDKESSLQKSYSDDLSTEAPTQKSEAPIAFFVIRFKQYFPKTCSALYYQ